MDLDKMLTKLQFNVSIVIMQLCLDKRDKDCCEEYITYSNKLFSLNFVLSLDLFIRESANAVPTIRNCTPEFPTFGGIA